MINRQGATMNSQKFDRLIKNPHVQGAAVELLVVNLKYTDATDEFGEEAGQVITDCLSAMGCQRNTRLRRRRTPCRKRSKNYRPKWRPPWSRLVFYDPIVRRHGNHNGRRRSSGGNVWGQGCHDGSGGRRSSWMFARLLRYASRAVPGRRSRSNLASVSARHIVLTRSFPKTPRRKAFRESPIPLPLLRTE